MVIDPIINLLVTIKLLETNVAQALQPIGTEIAPSPFAATVIGHPR
jgi:hypothetical protein